MSLDNNFATFLSKGKNDVRKYSNWRQRKRFFHFCDKIRIMQTVKRAKNKITENTEVIMIF